MNESYGPWIQERDVPNGKAGRAHIIDEDGRIQDLFRIKNLKASASISKEDFKVVGTNRDQKKVSGVKITGTMTVYEGETTWNAMLSSYLKQMKLPYFSCTVTVNDPSTSIGRQSIMFGDCQIDDADIIELDADKSKLEKSIKFTAQWFEVLEAFAEPANIGG